jgi:NTE family protein
MLAAREYENLKEIWENITYKSVFSGKLSFPSVIRPVFGFKSVLSNKPLAKLIAKYIKLEKIDKNYTVYTGVVSLYDGKYYCAKSSDFKDDKNFRNMILASTTIPVLHKPVKKVNLKDGRVLKFLVDGGIRHVSPIADVIDDEPDILIVINCTPKVSENKKAAKNIINIGQIALTQIMINENINSSLNDFIKINNIIKQAADNNFYIEKENGKFYKHYGLYHIDPDDDIGDMLDFSKESINSRIDKGFNKAKSVLSSLNLDIFY